MAHARTQCGAIYRMTMKRELRKRGLTVHAEITTKKLEKLYRDVTKKKLPRAACRRGGGSEARRLAKAAGVDMEMIERYSPNYYK